MIFRDQDQAEIRKSNLPSDPTTNSETTNLNFIKLEQVLCFIFLCIVVFLIIQNSWFQNWLLDPVSRISTELLLKHHFTPDSEGPSEIQATEFLSGKG